jgi:molybdopterin/thiamine biosynthesis adenylyltransferase
MDPHTMTPISFRMAVPQFATLMDHLFPGDGNEHGAVITAGVSRTANGVRLLARDVVLAKDGIDYVPGGHGYRALTADFVARWSNYCAREHLAYFAVHCHGGRDSVVFSTVDLASHRRGYPALLDIVDHSPVGALVFAQNAVAGEVWTKSGVAPLAGLTVVGQNYRRLFASPGAAPFLDPTYHRQSLLFGSVGQQFLAQSKIGIIGLGGAGSLINEWMAHLGVGEIVAIDFDKLDPTNRPRVVGASPWDACEILVRSRFAWVQAIGRRLACHKVTIAKRVATRANPSIRYTPVIGDVTDERTAALLRDCDFLFLCADSAQSRLVFNALVHQYLIPGIQVGSKVTVAKATGQVSDVFIAERPVYPIANGGCLYCNALIPANQLQREALPEEERRGQAYVDDDAVVAPSVITLNALACAQAANDFLFSYLSLYGDELRDGYLMHFPRDRKWRPTACRANPDCLHCGHGKRSAFARGDAARLPCKVS